MHDEASHMEVVVAGKAQGMVVSARAKQSTDVPVQEQILHMVVHVICASAARHAVMMRLVDGGQRKGRSGDTGVEWSTCPQT